MKTRSTFYVLITALLYTSCSVIHLVPSNKVYQIAFSEEAFDPNLQFVHMNRTNNTESEILIQSYDLDSVADLGESEFETALYLLNWTNSRWEHSGSNRPTDSRATTILKEAQEGNKFRCVEYGIVLRSVLSTTNIPARTLGLQSRDVEITRLGAGHVATEAWSEDHQKWFFMDAQYNVVPMLDNVPLNAVEFQEAIVSGKDLKLIDVNGAVGAKRTKKYLKFVSKYLYFFDFRFDQRYLPYEQLTKVGDKQALMLVPLGAKNPTVFQRKVEMDHLVYTNNLIDFYSEP